MTYFKLSDPLHSQNYGSVYPICRELTKRYSGLTSQLWRSNCQESVSLEETAIYILRISQVAYRTFGLEFSMFS